MVFYMVFLKGIKFFPCGRVIRTTVNYHKQGRELYLSIPFKDMGRITLSFTLPKSERFQGFKTSRPTVILNHKGQITFAFSIQKEVPKPTPTESVMGIDLGLVQPFTGTVIANGTYSQPIHPNHKVVHYQGKVQHLKKHFNFPLV